MSEPTDRDSEDLSPKRMAELEDRIEELSSTLAKRNRGPFGLFRPPTPGELLRVADEQAIPAAIAVLEAQIRVLKLLRETIRLIQRGEDRDPAEAAESAAADAMAELDRALADLRTALEGGGGPDDPAARSLLEDVREIRSEVADAVSAPESASTNSDDTSRRDRRGSTAEEPSKATEIDVQSELESIKNEVPEESINANEQDKRNGETADQEEQTESADGNDQGEPTNGDDSTRGHDRD